MIEFSLEETKNKIQKFVLFITEHKNDLATLELIDVIEGIINELNHFVDKSELKEIITEIKQTLNKNEEKFQDLLSFLDKRFEGLIHSTNKRFQDLIYSIDKRFKNQDKRFQELIHTMDKRF